MKAEKKSFYASIVGVVISSIVIIDFIVEIIIFALSLKDPSADHQANIEIGILSFFLVIFIITLALSAKMLSHTMNNRSIIDEYGKNLLLSTSVFDFFASFILFVYLFTKVNVISLIIYIIGFLLLLACGITYLVDMNDKLKDEKNRQNKLK